MRPARWEMFERLLMRERAFRRFAGFESLLFHAARIG